LAKKTKTSNFLLTPPHNYALIPHGLVISNILFRIGVPMQTTEIGEKLKQLRIRINLTQEELASRCDLSKGFISQLERGLTSPSIATLVDVLDSLGTNLTEFFQEPENEQIVFSPSDAFTTEDTGEGCRICWIVPNAQKNIMEPIIVKLKPKGNTAKYRPHPGDAMGYVISGAATLHLNGESRKIKKGECFYYTASSPYYLENHTESPATVLWITSPPNF